MNVNEILLPIMERIERVERLINQKKTPSLLTIKDIIQYTKLSESTIRRAVLKGTLKPIKETGKKLFRQDDVDRWITRQ